jgi:transcriptional regulator with XRE-family HTH domain
MAQVPRVLTPYRSVQHYFGAELRSWRILRNLSQAELGRLVLHSGHTIGKVEKAERWPSAELARRCDEVLAAGGALDRLWPLVERERRCERGDADPGFADAGDTGRQDAEVGLAGEAMRRRSVAPLIAAVLVGGVLGPSTQPSAAEVNPLARRLREAAATRRNWESGPPLADLDTAKKRVAAVHAAYQAADYASAAHILPGVLAGTERLCRDQGVQERDVHRVHAIANVAASKLAAKLGDHSLAWVMADRAGTSARFGNDQVLWGLSSYQAACALQKMPGRAGDAQELLGCAHDQLSQHGPATPAAISVRGSLLLLAAVLSARAGQDQAAVAHLATAKDLAHGLGHDGNHLWTGFGPINVRIHEIGVAVALGHPGLAVEVGEHLDTSSLPAALVSRRAQLHLELAWAYAHQCAGDHTAVLHLLEAERIAPQIIGVYPAARTLLANLMTRERASVTPGLRSLARRSGVLV